MSDIARKYHDGVVARIVSSSDGGPIRRILNGRSRRPTGTYVSSKAGMRAMPWESRACELPAMQLAEVSAAVHSFLAQPHRLELRVQGRPEKLDYLPDLQMEVDVAVAARLAAGSPLGRTLMRARPSESPVEGTRTVIVELKSDVDRRMQDANYRVKLRLAEEVYRKLGYVFIIATETRDLASVDLDAVKQISMDRLTRVASVDVDRAVQCLERAGAAASLADVREALGGGHVGRAKAYALHVRRVVAIDLREPIGPESRVRLVRGHSSAGRDRGPGSALPCGDPYALPLSENSYFGTESRHARSRHDTHERVLRNKVGSDFSLMRAPRLGCHWCI